MLLVGTARKPPQPEVGNDAQKASSGEA